MPEYIYVLGIDGNQDMQCKTGTCISKSRARRMKKVLPLG